MRFFSLLILLLLGTGAAFSQSISGNLKSTESSEALKYGNVDIYKGDKLVASVLTDRLGNFAVALDTGTYVCVINYSGYKTETKEIKVTKDEVADFKISEDPSKPKPAPASESEDIAVKRVSTSISSVSVSSKGSRSPGRSHKSKSAAYGDFGGSSMGDGSVGTDMVSYPTESPTAGKLTAGEVNDFSKWKMWQNIAKNELNAYQASWNVAPYGRYTLMLQSQSGLPLADALVKLFVANKLVFTSRTDNTGKAELWLTIKNEKPEVNGKVSMEVTYDGKTTKINKVDAFEKSINHQVLNVSCQEVENVDIAFVVDATGSMGDELEYLKTEMNDIIFQSKQISSKLNFRFANVFYRDEGLSEQYTTKKMDFTRVLTESTDYITQQYAGGGGDYEEAVELALDTAINKLSWSESARTRVLFLILDAPPHNTAVNQEKLQKIIEQAAEKGIRIVPIGASGINKSTEYLMRALALGTNGTYTFLTDHSGIGNGHIAPSTDKYEVETLNALVVRILKSYTYMPDCNQQIPDLSLDYPDSIVTTVPQRDSTDSSGVKPDPKALNITWSYYPNPTNGIVNVLPNTDIKELYVTDLSGKVLQIITNLEKERRIQIDLSNYPTGIYLFRYPVDDHWISGKIVLHRTS